MRVKLDENIPATLVPALSALGHDVDTVVEQGLGGLPDEDVWSAVKRDRRFLVTQDLDFSDIRTFSHGDPAGILPVRLKVPGRSTVATRIQSLFTSEDVGSWEGCVVIASDRKLRVRRL